MKKFDIPLIFVTCVLVAFGMVMVYSASGFLAAEESNNPYHYVERQGLAVALGLTCLLVGASTPYRRLIKLAPSLYGAALAALVAVWVPGLGHAANGAQRWFHIAGMNFQPAELAKLVVLICFATWLDRNRGAIHDVRNVLLPAAVGLALPLGCIILQPDFGSTAIICVLSCVMLFLAGLRWSWILSVVGGGAALLAVVMLAEPYRRARITSFMDPFADCSGPGYQVCQSLLALNHGGLGGQGLGLGKAKLLYLPEPHNDFIAAVIGEELGLWGVILLLLLFGLFAWRGFSIARRAPDLFGGLLAGTFTVMIVGQACLNLGVVMSVVPPKGLVLPFMSYGASAMMVNLAAVGILLSVSAATEEAAEKGAKGAPAMIPTITGVTA